MSRTKNAEHVSATIVIIGSESKRAEVVRKLGEIANVNVVCCMPNEDLTAVLTKTTPPASSKPATVFSARKTSPVLTLGGATIDITTGALLGPVALEQLTSTELRLAEYLCRADGPRTAKRIAAELFDRSDQSCVNLVHKHIGNLRAKLARVGASPQPVQRVALGYGIPGRPG